MKEVDAMTWEVKFPIKRSNGARGVQWFLYNTTFRSDARDAALRDVASADAVRHRGGAEVNCLAMEVRPWSAGSVSL
ncbi:hypothetical protein AB0L49_23880 [Streptomyces antimycoticus]|uniref:hypothetical protein n=1 Tax=Streptomyces antimycoticus TaxID=68175 RepID=UPI00342A49EB